jgi:hypothetical protein
MESPGFLKAVSIVQPWAWLVVEGEQIIAGGKTIENRTWATTYRGPLLIHASGRTTVDTVNRVRTFVRQTFGAREAALVPDATDARLRFGGIIGRVELVDVLPPTSRPSNPWHMRGSYGWVFADARPVTFLPCAGALQLWGRFVEVGLGIVAQVKRP